MSYVKQDLKTLQTIIVIGQLIAVAVALVLLYMAVMIPAPPGHGWWSKAIALGAAGWGLLSAGLRLYFKAFKA